MKERKRQSQADAVPASQTEERVQHAPGGLKGRWMINSLSFVVAILAAVIIIASISISSYYYTNVRDNLLNRAAATANTFRNYWTDTRELFYTNADKYLTSISVDDKARMEVQFLNATDNAIFLSTSGLTMNTVPTTSDAVTAMNREDPKITSWSGEDPQTKERVLCVTAPIRNQNGELVGGVRYITSLTKVDQQITQMILIVVGACLIFLVLVVASNQYFLKSILVPVTRINATAREIAAGHYGIRLHKTYDDEIGELCDTINYMSDELRHSEKMKNDFISSVSHELRTPLTAIGGWSETLIAGGATDSEEVMQGLEIIQKESHRLTQMVEELLDFSRIESGRMKLNVESFDVSLELYEAVYMYENLLENAHIVLNYQEESGANFFINGDRHRIKQVFLNTIDNAAKYGGDGGKIDISIANEEGEVVICVLDHGAGIPEEELPFVKEKFYKGSSKQRGNGIGLAVTDEIVQLHGGTLDIQSKVGVGTAVHIRLPAVDVHTALGVGPDTEEALAALEEDDAIQEMDDEQGSAQGRLPEQDTTLEASAEEKARELLADNSNPKESKHSEVIQTGDEETDI